MGRSFSRTSKRGDSLSQPQVSYFAFSSQPNLREEASRQNAGRSNQNEPKACPHHPTSSIADWDTETVLDTTCNCLQELLQLLYLLSRDPGVPDDARHHVTVAQSEIALLSRQMQNSTAAETGVRSRAQPAV
jgi:hypothetical protein